MEGSHEEELEESARKEEIAKKDTRQKASDELAKWYQDRHAELAKRLEVNRAQEQEIEAGRLAALKPEANPWERVVDLIDTNSRTADEARDCSRMRARPMAGQEGATRVQMHTPFPELRGILAG